MRGFSGGEEDCLVFYFYFYFFLSKNRVGKEWEKGGWHIVLQRIIGDGGLSISAGGKDQ